ncbi:BatA (Bacteroides aerotolerance operon) [uncultured Candidatus Thioglobus sp.]|nr:BatA (Bacteroides aerotolerance operon) [uncultured Candidatus Thioglobus sp.]
MHFEFPWVLWFLPAVFVCLFFCKEKKQAIYFPQTTLLKKLLNSKQLLFNSLKFLILALSILALASPIKTQEIILDNTKGYEISLILDASGSMLQFDKFKIVKKIVNDFISQRKTDKLALSIFANFAYIVVPLTYDKKSVKKLLKKIEVGIAGRQKTALNEALFLSSKLFKHSKAKHRIAILLTDGRDNTNSVPLEVAIKQAKDNKIKVYTIGIGSNRDFDSGILKQIANETGGRYFSANNARNIKHIYAQINSLEKSKLKINKYQKNTYYFHYLLMLALLFSLFYFYLKNTWNFNK